GHQPRPAPPSPPGPLPASRTTSVRLLRQAGLLPRERYPRSGALPGPVSGAGRTSPGQIPPPGAYCSTSAPGTPPYRHYRGRSPARVPASGPSHAPRVPGRPPAGSRVDRRLRIAPARRRTRAITRRTRHTRIRTAPPRRAGPPARLGTPMATGWGEGGGGSVFGVARPGGFTQLALANAMIAGIRKFAVAGKFC